MRYEYKQEDLYAFVSAMGYETKARGGELLFKRCPYCDSGGHKDDFWKFSVNIEKGVYNCFRASCGEKGHFIKLARDFGYEVFDDFEPEYRTYDNSLKWDSTAEAIRYLQSRGIPESITKKCEITTLYDKPNILVFPFWNEYHIQKSVKYRNMTFRKGIDKSKEWFDENAMPILYGMWLWKDFTKPLVITEGQIDMLSLMSAGIENAVSVPNGANAFTWTKYCREWVEKFPEIIVFGDNEHGKITLVDKIETEFPTIPVKAVRIPNYMSCKDANEILMTQRIENDFTPAYKILQAAVNHAEDARKLPVMTVDDIDWTDFTPPPVVKTGFPTLDEKIRGFEIGSFNVLSGISGVGKSNFTLQLVANAIHTGKKVLIYSGEITNKKIIQQLALIVSGRTRITDVIDPNSGESHKEPKQGISEIIKEWLRNRLYLWNDEAIAKDETDEEKKAKFVKNLKRVVSAHHIDLVVLDNLMTLTSYSTDKDLYNQQSAFAQSLKDTAQELQTVLILVAHPRKTANAGGKIKYDDISGSMNIVNLCSLGIFYTRVEDSDDPYIKFSNRQIVVFKNRENGVVLEGKDAVRTCFSMTSKRIFEAPKTDDGKHLTDDPQKIADAQIDYLSLYPPTKQMLDAMQPPY